MKYNYNDVTKVQYYLSGFLISCRNIPTHLLEEYSYKYSLKISSDRKLNSQMFRLKSIGNKSALSFIDYFELKIQEIKEDKIGGFMWQRRNIHRFSIRPEIIKIKVPINSIGQLESIGVFDPRTPEEIMQDNIDTENERRLQEMGIENGKTRSASSFLFNEYSEIEVKDGCKIFLDLMKSFTSEIYNKFPYNSIPL